MKKLLSLLLLGILFMVLGAFKSQKKINPTQNYHNISNIDQTPAISGKDLYIKKGCNLCHHPEKKIVGPSFKEISSVYNGNKEDLLKFLNSNAQPKVDPEEFSFMKSVLIQLKKMKPEEREALAEYILSNK